MSFTTQQKHLEVEELSGDALKVLNECGRQLKSAPFKDNGKFEFINAREILAEASREFVKLHSKVNARTYLRWKKTINFKKPDCLLIAWRFSRAMTLSLPPKVTLDIIPFDTSGTPTVGGVSISVGKIIHVAKEVEIRSTFICLVRVYGTVP